MCSPLSSIKDLRLRKIDNCYLNVKWDRNKRIQSYASRRYLNRSRAEEEVLGW